MASNGGTYCTSETLSNLLYLDTCHAMRTCHAKIRYFDWDGQLHLTKGKTGGQKGDPLEMLVFNLTTIHFWGRTLKKPLLLLMLRMVTSKPG